LALRDRENCQHKISTEAASVAEPYSRYDWFEPDFVIDRISEPLLAAQVSFRRLDTHVTEQELDLLKFPTSFVTQSGARATQIVRSNIFDAALRRALFHYAPDHLWAEAPLPNTAGLVDGPKNRPGGDCGGDQPVIHCRFHPIGHGYGPHVAALAD
jgi:hypothetical protein